MRNFDSPKWTQITLFIYKIINTPFFIIENEHTHTQRHTKQKITWFLLTALVICGDFFIAHSVGFVCDVCLCVFFSYCFVSCFYIYHHRVRLCQFIYFLLFIVFLFLLFVFFLFWLLHVEMFAVKMNLLFLLFNKINNWIQTQFFHFNYFGVWMSVCVCVYLW